VVLLFSYKEAGGQYRIGFAFSRDGKTWTRVDEHDYRIPRSDWDSEMQAYAVVLRTERYEFILYNGNRYGYDGAGYAVREL